VREGTLEDRSSRRAAKAQHQQLVANPDPASGFACRIVHLVVTEAFAYAGYVLPTPRPLAHHGPSYLALLALLNERLVPRSYFEIGTHTGESLAAFSCDAVCVDPEFELRAKPTGVRARTLLYQMTSDAFFANHDLHRDIPGGPDICFLDGMHHAEFLLRDFINAERYCHANSLILLHDCLPTTLRMADRRRFVDDTEDMATRHLWTGDVWRVMRALRRHRPDLKLRMFNCPPSGLIACTDLDPHSDVLAQGYDAIVDEMLAESLSDIGLDAVWQTYPLIDTAAATLRAATLPAMFPGLRG
jgi:hypothetical protein